MKLILVNLPLCRCRRRAAAPPTAAARATYTRMLANPFQDTHKAQHTQMHDGA